MIYILNNRQVNSESMTVDGVDREDYPRFTDAYLLEASWMDDGGALSDAELEELQDEYPHLPAELAFESLLT
jgi:hypothetical protein